MPARGWAIPYVGIPFADRGRSRAGCDCWGLVWLALREVFGIDAPIYGDGYETAADRAEIARLVEGELPAWREVTDPREGDVALFRVCGVHHCGIVLPQGRMLHTMRGHDSAVTSYRSPRYHSRLLGFYRWEGDR